MQRTQRFLGILLVNAALLAVGIAALELGFGGWLDSRKLNRLNLIRDSRFAYDVSDIYASPDPIITYSRDRHGLRGNFSSPAQIDLLTVGGSTTDQRYIRDGETWQDVMERRFEEADAPVVVANAGVDGQSTFGHIKNFQWWFPNVDGLEPEYILYYVGVNDFYKDEATRYDNLLGQKQAFDPWREIRENSAIWNLSRTLHGTYVALVEKKIGHRAVDFETLTWTRETLQTNYTFMKPRLLAYAQRLRILAELSRAFGAEPIFASQPTRHYRQVAGNMVGISDVTLYGIHEINGKDQHFMMRKLDEVTRSVAKEKQVAFIDLASHDGWTDEDFYDLSHMTPQGAAKVGDLFYQALKDRLTLLHPKKRP